MFEADITKVVEEMAIRIRETEEDFILDTIFSYCQETLQRKINKAELKQIILRGSKPKGKWIITYPDGAKAFKCNQCNKYADVYHTTNYCPTCGAEMIGDKENEEKTL